MSRAGGLGWAVARGRAAGWLRGFLGLAWMAAGTPTPGWVGETNNAGQWKKWALNPVDARVKESSVNRTTRAVIYRLDAAGYSATNTAAELMSIRNAFDQWQAVPGTVLRFEEGPAVSGVTDIQVGDYTNTFFWARSLFINGRRDNLAGIQALTYVGAIADGNVIADSDTVFNGVQFRWFTDYQDPTTQGTFVEAIALHEIGHLLGLRHSPVGGATMLAVGDYGVNSQVGLASDELTAARFLYGTAATAGSVGRIAGVVSAAGVPLFGAAVFAEDPAGNVVAGTVTSSNGTYELGALAPGTYTVRAAPLDPASAAQYLVRGSDVGAAFRNATVDFRPAADRTAVVVAKGTAAVPLAVTSAVPLRIVRLLRPAPDLATPGFNNKPVSVAPEGQTLYLGVLTPAALTGDARLTATGNGLSFGAVEIRDGVLPGLNLVAVPVTFAPDATPGLRSLRLEVGGETAWAHGFLEILPPFPDVNFDGFDDRFQRRYWPRFTGPQTLPVADPDGDGFTNRWEYGVGSDPTNRLSANFEIESVRVTTQGARVRSQTAAGKRFQLFTRDTVPGSEWRAVGGAVTATGGTTEFADATATNRVRFYRVQLLP